ncbi:hypothetical protein AB190_19805 [Enterobacter asburiae]|nr:hypothetical protein AB190_19805 [Enterobacter asburiae]
MLDILKHPLAYPGNVHADNLHIYTQRNTRQRKAEFVDDRKQYENKYLRNEGYAVEVPELYAAIDENAVTIGELVEPSEG